MSELSTIIDTLEKQIDKLNEAIDAKTIKTQNHAKELQEANAVLQRQNTHLIQTLREVLSRLNAIRQKWQPAE